jgi:hypothetical protein
MVKYLKDQYGNRPSSKSITQSTNTDSWKLYLTYFIVNENERMELEFLRQEVERLKKAKGEVKSIKDLFN